MTRATLAAPARAGFTLMEVLVALVVGAISLSAAAVLFVTLAARETHLRTVASRTDRLAATELILVGLFRHVDAQAGVGAPLVGDSLGLDLSSWCGIDAASMRRCRAHVAVRERGNRAVLVLRLSTRGRSAWESEAELDLQSAASVELRYLVDAGNGGLWATRWDKLHPPAAVLLTLDHDTLLLPIGNND